MFRFAIVLTLVVILAGAPAAVANVPLLQHRVLGYLTFLPEDYKSISPADVKARLDANDLPFVVDVREREEFAQGHIAGAVNIPIRTLAANLSRLPSSRSAEIVTICPSGFRSAQVTMALTLLGYTNVKTMVLGMREWNARGFPIVR